MRNIKCILTKQFNLEAINGHFSNNFEVFFTSFWSLPNLKEAFEQWDRYLIFTFGLYGSNEMCIQKISLSIIEIKDYVCLTVINLFYSTNSGTSWYQNPRYDFSPWRFDWILGCWLRYSAWTWIRSHKFPKRDTYNVYMQVIHGSSYQSYYVMTFLCKWLIMGY